MALCDPPVERLEVPYKQTVLRLGLLRQAAGALPQADEDTLRRLTGLPRAAALRWRIIKGGGSRLVE